MPGCLLLIFFSLLPPVSIVENIVTKNIGEMKEGFIYFFVAKVR